MMCVVIIFETDDAVEASCTVLSDLIFILEGCDEVFGILILSIIDSKIIKN